MTHLPDSQVRAMPFQATGYLQEASLGRIANKNCTFLASPLYMFWRNIVGKTCTKEWRGMSSSYLESYAASVSYHSDNVQLTDSPVLGDLNSSHASFTRKYFNMDHIHGYSRSISWNRSMAVCTLPPVATRAAVLVTISLNPM